MPDWPLRWTDRFPGVSPGDYWVGGYTNDSREATITIADGVHIEFVSGHDYASAGLVTRAPIVGDFDARLQFTVERPQLGTTFELAAITVDPPRESGLDHDDDNPFALSRAYDVHGAPPYVSSEFDEGDGWRIGWNRGSAQTLRTDDGRVISDNHFNRYGKDLGEKPEGAASGWLRLCRTGPHWTSYRLQLPENRWVATGEVRDMNMPDAVFLRIAAKHWVKMVDKVPLPAPRNRVHFHEFQMRSVNGGPARNEAGRPTEPREVFAVTAETPIEIRLVQQVRACKKCSVFASETPFGPFPHVTLDADARSMSSTELRGEVTAFHSPEPAVMHGCRKAPLMLVGINPNLPGYFIFPRKGAKRDARNGSYRVFSDLRSDQDYATYYRFAPGDPLELKDLDVLSSMVRTSDTINAVEAGLLTLGDPEEGASSRDPARRAAQLHGVPPTSVKRQSLQWQADENLALLRHEFDAGQTVAGFIDASSTGRPVALIRGSTDSYYRNAGKLLDVIGSQIEGAHLELGEDLALHDAVACASPGWTQWPLPRDEIQSNCIEKSRWLQQQIEQTDPAVLLITSREALGLFVAGAGGSFLPSLDSLPVRAGGREGLFHVVARDGLWWQRQRAGVPAQTRIVLAPHLSYDDNFIPHCYLTVTDQDELAAQWPQAMAWLKLQSRNGRPVVQKVFDTPDLSVELGDPVKNDDPLWDELLRKFPAPGYWLQSRWIDPREVIGGAVADEIERLKLGLDAHGHLMRSKGACVYCDNAYWKIGDGCAYEPQPAVERNGHL